METLARMLIQGVVRVLQNRQKANKGVGSSKMAL